MPRPSRYSALDYLHDRFIGNDPKMIAALDRERLNMAIGQQIYDLRTAAGLTQRQLAVRVGTSTSVICRLEDSDYYGHSLSLLRRIASALSHQVDVRFVPAAKKAKARPKARKRRIA